MTTNTKSIGDGAYEIIKVWGGYAIEIGDNGETADARVALMLGPAVESEDQYLWIETNGDPLMIGWLEDGSVVYNEAEFVGVGGRIVDMEHEGMEWIARLIDEELPLYA